MKDILGYYSDRSGNPIAYMRRNGLIVFSTKKSLYKIKKLGDDRDLIKIFSNLNYYTVFPKPLKGGGGLFGESNGPCGWNGAPGCCFYDCEPLWRTTLWPLTDGQM